MPSFMEAVVALLLNVAADALFCWCALRRIASEHEDTDIDGLLDAKQSASPTNSVEMKGMAKVQQEAVILSKRSPHALSTTTQIVLVASPSFFGLLMMTVPWLSFWLLLPAMAALFGWAIGKAGCARHTDRSGGSMPNTKAKRWRGLADSMLLLSRPCCARSLGSVARPLVFPWVTFVIIILCQALYFVDVFASARWTPSNGPIYMVASDWIEDEWWGLFSTFYNGAYFLLHMHLGGNMLQLAVFGFTSESAWGWVRSYGLVLPLVVLGAPRLYRPGRGTGTSILTSALGGSFLTHSALTLHRWRVHDLPRHWAACLLLWVVLGPASFFAGNVDLTGHGKGLLLGSTSAMAAAALFDGWPTLGQRHTWWAVAWSAVGSATLLCVIAVGATVCGWRGAYCSDYYFANPLR